MPRLYLLGGMKCATTSLATALREQGVQSYAEPKKELQWFTSVGPSTPIGKMPVFDGARATDHARQEWLHLGPPCPQGPRHVLADYTPVNLRFGGELARALHGFYGLKSSQLRFVVLLRDPLERMHSHYYHDREIDRRGLISMGDLLQRQLQVARATPKKDWASTSMLDSLYRSMYGMQVPQFLAEFPADQFFVAPFRTFIEHQGLFVDAILDSVGLPPNAHGPGYNWPKAGGRGRTPTLDHDVPPFSPLRQRAAAFFGEDRRVLAEALWTAHQSGAKLFGFRGHGADDVSKWLVQGW